MIDWGQILTAVLVAVIPTLAAVVVKIAWTWAQTKQAQLSSWQPTIGDFVERAATFAVQAAEQSGLANLIQDKKNYAIEVAQKWLQAQGIKGVDLKLLDAAIEQAVGDLFPHDNADQAAVK